MNLSAQTSGPYKGILFYQQRGNTNAATFSKNNSTAIALSGALYFPDANVSIKNNNGNVTNDCTLIIAKSLSFDNNSTLTNTCSAYGGSPFQTVSLAE